jgi:hypothetical protein
MPLPRKVRRLAWFVIPVLLGAGALYGVLAPKRHHEPESGLNAAGLSESQRASPQMRQAVELMRARDPARVIEAYAAWASDSAALEARKALLNSLFREENLATKLSSVLAAIEADSTPAEQDPLWPYLTESLSELWQGDTATRAMDLVIAETRPRARRALVSSFANLATSERLSELSPEQRQTLTETMIDIAPQVPATQKPEVIEALRRLGGNDLADIASGKGLTGTDGHELESETAYKQSLEETKRALAR